MNPGDPLLPPRLHAIAWLLAALTAAWLGWASDDDPRRTVQTVGGFHRQINTGAETPHHQE